MTKRNVYSSCLLGFLFALAADAVVGIVLSTIHAFSATQEQLGDAIIIILCFVLLLAFLTLEIVNTFRSFRHGSQFILSLAYNEDGNKNTPFLVISGLLFLLGLVCFVWGILLMCGLSVFLSDTVRWDGGHLIMAFGALLWINFGAVLLFPVWSDEKPEQR